MFCKKCGNSVEEGTVFCAKCGAAVSVDQSEQNQSAAGFESEERVAYQNYSQQQGGSVVSVTQRSIATSILLSLLTCGIYGLFWFYSLLSDLYRLTNQDGKAGIDILFIILTGGIYGIYLNYAMGKMLYVVRNQGNLPEKDDSALFLLLGIVNLGIINYSIVQSDFNQLSISGSRY